jgi:hypothetical protein
MPGTDVRHVEGKEVAGEVIAHVRDEASIQRPEHLQRFRRLRLGASGAGGGPGRNHALNLTSSASGPLGESQGGNVKFTATVSASAPGAGSPTGTVEFKEGATVVASAELQTADGVTSATATVVDLPVGDYTMTASYIGDGNFSASSAGVELDVTPSGIVMRQSPPSSR